MSKNYYLKGRCLPLMAAMAICGQAHAFTPVAPGNLSAKCSGIVVDLSWEWGNAGQTVSAFGFEGDDFPENCEIKTTHPEPECNWITYSFEGAEETFAHSGDYVAMLMMGSETEADPANHQDEWLVLKPGAGAVYMDFWYYLHPELLEVGGFRDFPDHYYVHISRDNGATWTELWDGRWDMGDVDAVQQASLFLGEPTDDNTLVAFNAVSDELTSLYFLWMVDDVEFLSADEKVLTNLKATARKSEARKAAPRDLALMRGFKPAAGAEKAPRREPSEWLNNGLTTFRIYAGNMMVADYLKARHFTEYSAKDPGMYEYRVMAWNEAENREYEAASVMVDVTEFEFAAPRNPKASYEPSGDDRYAVSVAWEAPEGDLQPSHYVVYLNGKSLGWLDPAEELSMGQTGLYKGLYNFEVEAVYAYPEGVSARVSASAAPGTVMGVGNLRVTASGTGHVIEWDAPRDVEPAPVAYSVYRGDVALSESTPELSFTDADAPEGLYSYHVHAIYADGQVSLPASQPAPGNRTASATLPFKETFDNGHLPANWETELVDPNGTVKDMYSWRFDNWFGIEVPAEMGVSGGFASVSGIAAGMNKLESHLITPAFEVGEDGAILKYDQFYLDELPGPSGAAQAQLSATGNNGTTWIELENVALVDNGNVEVDLSDFAGNTVRVRWSFLGRKSGVLAVDNVEIASASQNGVTSVTVDAPSTVDVFTPSGTAVARGIAPERVAQLPAGLYIVVSGTSASKTVVR